MKKIGHILDKRNAILISVVLAISGIIGFWIPFQRAQRPIENTNSANHAEIIIEYGENGFTPQTITVPTGATVGWRNPTGRPMWVGSDPHPAHTDLPGFDQKKVINLHWPSFVQTAHAHGDGIFEYTFTKPGIWKYHNHIYPSHRGLVIVNEEN